MKKDEFNYAPVVVTLGLSTLVFMTFWFPIRLAKTINASLPVVEPYDSLGQRRSEHELEMEYQRLLKRDRSPFSFLYNEYKRKWGAFKAVYLGVKLTSLLIVAVVSPDSCLALSLAKNHISRGTLAIARQATLLAAMAGFLVLQTVAAPFVDPVNNANEWTSRMNFVLTALLGLLVALNVPGQTFWNGWGLYGLDISPSSKHLTQRIWQESLTTLLLAAPQCKMPASQKMVFADGVEVTSEESTPPYLLDFAGSPAERHVENLKILREVGLQAYQRPLRMSQSDQKRTTELRHKILQHIIGPDAFWCPTGMADAQSCAVSYFGNAWCIPFPLTVVIRYDHDGSLTCITDLRDLEHFVWQNEDRDTEKRREIRIALRCLDKTRVKWPYTHTELVGNRFRWLGGRQYEAHHTTDYYEPILAIQRNGTLTWGNVNLASGFGISLHYARNVAPDGSLVGLNDALDLTPQLARFLLLNKPVLDDRISEYLVALRAYRDYMHREVAAKAAALSYGFLDSIYSAPASPDTITRILAKDELDLRVRELAVSYGDAFETMDERIRYVGRNAISGWWYLFWDDYWRRNKATIASLATHRSDFDPHYPTSIAYNPLSRAALEAFLKQRGLWSATPTWYGNWYWFHTGLINKVYFHLHWIAFAGSSKVSVV
ncbi:hypothetical protein FRC10_000925 [Ceratobasidium sp. 414]|nr:hypothetical protein FRC10_000925 [Ceratobasidium sp. 414]